jgi:hypothetical protein
MHRLRNGRLVVQERDDFTEYTLPGAVVHASPRLPDRLADDVTLGPPTFPGESGTHSSEGRAIQ